ncbi:hypothetical protein [Streptomyces sp. NBC_00569]|uniref:thiolase family protein n=1 Tax=Streptomyces sp. NBC_00569 TaxID=2975780 RepID=UPI003FCED7B8
MSRADDGPRAGTTYGKLAQLAPALRENSTVTAGNCCPLNDGAAAVVVMSDVKARELSAFARSLLCMWKCGAAVFRSAILMSSISPLASLP